MTWTFQSYDKIPSSSRRWDASPGDIRRLDQVDWVVTEKIHGASFCFVLSAGRIDCAKRKAVLGEEEDFFGHRRLLERLRGPLRKLFIDAREEASRLLVYGELFGGGYPHPLVPAVAGVQPVQTGVWYCPDVAFRAFDVVAEDAQGRRQWWTHDQAAAGLGAAGVPTLEPLFIGPYGAAREQSAVRETAIPALLGLPPLEDNFAEGIVLKPRVPVLVGGLRPTLKLKHPRFAEDARYQQAERWAPLPQEAAPLDVLEHALLCRLTTARFDAARSKLGPTARASALGAEVRGDVYGELIEEHRVLMVALPVEDRRLLEETLVEEAAALVRRVMAERRSS